MLDVCFSRSWLADVVLLRKLNQSLLRKQVSPPLPCPRPHGGCFDGYSAGGVVLLLLSTPFQYADRFLDFSMLSRSSPAATFSNQPVSVYDKPWPAFSKKHNLMEMAAL